MSMTTQSPYGDPRPGGSDPQYPTYDPHQYGVPYGYYGAPYGSYYGAPLPPPPQAPQRRKRRWVLGSGITVLVAAAVVAGVAVAETGSTTLAGSGSTVQLVPTNPGGGNSNMGPNGNTGNGTSQSVSLATAKQQKGVVTIVSVLRYQNAESAGTGMILTSDGEVVTNNHVVNGATSITVTVASTGKSYRAAVVGTDPSEDVAVLQLQNASGLTTANVGGSSGIKVGDAVVGVGNAQGTGTLRASSGAVTGLNKTITATDDNGQNAERLTGLIEVNAPIISGDSGGPLYDSAGEIVGMDTAASATQAVATTAYAIPIEKALKVAQQIETKIPTSKIHIGLPAFLGVGIGQDTGNGAVVTQLLPGGPAAAAGILPGSVITAVDGHQVTSGASLKTALSSYRPGQQAKITWTDSTGQSQSATVTLGTGPAD